jgi:hypothetical protein
MRHPPERGQETYHASAPRRSTKGLAVLQGLAAINGLGVLAFSAQGRISDGDGMGNL